VTPKKIDVGFNDKFEVPGTSTLYYWNENDHNNLKSFAKSVVFKSGNINDWGGFIVSGNKIQKNYVMPIGKVKGFSFKYKGVEFEFKRALTSEGFLNEFGTTINGRYIPYVKTDFINLSFWEDYGPTILNIASVAVAVLGPATWPLLLTSAGLDLSAAKMQYEQGDVEGAKLSALLSLTPFLGKFAIKVPKVDADDLAQKFVNAATKSDVDRIVSTLTNDELKTLQSLQELGDIKKIQSMVNDPEVKLAINKSAKNISGISKKSIQRAGVELSSSGIALAGMWNKMITQELRDISRKELLYQTIQMASEITETEEKEKIQSLSKEIGTAAKNEILNQLKILIEQAKQKNKEEQNKKLIESEKDFNAVINFLQESDSLDEKIGSDATNIVDNINNIGEISVR